MSFHLNRKKFILILIRLQCKIIKVDLAIVGDNEVLKATIKKISKKQNGLKTSNKQNVSKWWEQIQKWRTKDSLGFINSEKTIKPQHAVKRLYELTKNQILLLQQR